MRPHSAQGSEPRRLLSAGAFVVIGLALVGLVAGTRSTSYEPIVPRRQAAAPGSMDDAALPARSYTELMTRPWGSERPHSVKLLAALARPDRSIVAATQHDARKKAQEERAEHRAFEGAPPTIPHPVAQDNGLECRECHLRGGMMGQALVPPLSHEPYQQCTQCHVPERSSAPRGAIAFDVANRFEPQRAAPAPSRWSIAPPQTPHSTLMRDRCDSCHGVYGRHGLQTTHPERQSCEQCHASSAAVDLRPPPP